MFRMHRDHIIPIASLATVAEPVPCALPLLAPAVEAGFPSPAADHMEAALDINGLLVRRPAATFFCRAQGDSMREAGIFDGDLLVVDRSLEPHPGDVVVATLDGGLVVKCLSKVDDQWLLASANPDYPTLEISPEEGVTIFGVVAHAITSFCDR